MQITAYLLLTAAFLFALCFAGVATWQAAYGSRSAKGTGGTVGTGGASSGLPPSLPWAERGLLMLTAFLTLASLILLQALASGDFSFQYVASYTDLTLPKFYKLTAFWAGQAGSMLFWAWSVAIFGVFFYFSESYKKLTPDTKLIFWALFLSIMAFFLLILTSWSNPFITLSPAPPDGRGLNPLLQNPGMIFHPPLLFLGYGGFVIPGCLALAQSLSGKRAEEGSWVEISRPFILLAWLLLTSGIVLGAWWAYMELGWGGYWAWDPVENASLIPWLIASAFLHTSIIESRRNKLHRTNVLLIGLTTISAFFATYLVRSGIVESVHAFGDGGVGTPLLIFIIFSTIYSICIASIPVVPREADKSLSQPFSREGMLVLVTAILLLLGFVVGMATMWPVFSKFFLGRSIGLEAPFYNRVCLPLFALLAVMLPFCPWMSWKGGLRNKKLGIAFALVAILVAIAIYMMGYSMPNGSPLPQLSAGFAVATIVSLIVLLVKEPAVRGQWPSLGAHGVHIGLAMMVLGVALSGPFKDEAQDVAIGVGQKSNLGGYDFLLKELNMGEASGYQFLEAVLEVSKNGKVLGVVSPQQRIYANFPRQTFLESDTLPSLGNEVYASVFGVDEKERAVLNLSLHPLVNWLWIGGTLMCVFPFLGLLGKRRREGSDSPDSSGLDGVSGSADSPNATDSVSKSGVAQAVGKKSSKKNGKKVGKAGGSEV